MIRFLSKNKQVIAWSIYDFANQPFTTLIVTFIFSAFFTEYLASDTQQGTYLWSLGISITAVFVALCSPILGALADAGGYRKYFLMGASYLCIFATFCLYFFHPDQVFNLFGFNLDVAICALITFIFANIGFEFGTVFCNSYLTDLSTSNNIGKVSGYAWGLGFIGGLISLAISLVFLDLTIVSHIRLVSLIVAVWFLVFSIPTFYYMSDKKSKGNVKKHFKQSLKSITLTFKNISQHKSIIRFLIARLFYNDALITIFAFGGIYAAGTLGFDFNEILLLGVMLNIAACIGSFLFGFLEDKIGVKKMLNITLWSLIFSTLVAYLAPFLTTQNHLINPKTLFWFAGIIIGLMQGPNQSGSRSLMARLTPENKKNEFFGFYAFSGKATAFIGPFLFGILTKFFDQQTGLLVVIVFFIIGLIIFQPLNLTSNNLNNGK